MRVCGRTDAGVHAVGQVARFRSKQPLEAIDPEVVPLGAPVWLEKDGADPIRRLMVAQDTGSAVKGAQRADVFYGTGAEAGEIAGRVRDTGRMIVLLPIEEALALVDAG